MLEKMDILCQSSGSLESLLRHDAWHLNLQRLRDAFALSQLTVGADHPLHLFYFEFLGRQTAMEYGPWAMISLVSESGDQGRHAKK